MKLGLLLSSAAAAAAVPFNDICSQDADPCLPGGKWDPITQACGAYSTLDCYACYTGDMCDQIVPNCTLYSQGGEPLFAQPYFEGGAMAHGPCTAVPADYRMAYQNRPDGGSFGSVPLLTALEERLRALHDLNGNAVTEDRQLVVGFGGTQVMRAAIYAKALLTNVTTVTAQIPYFTNYAYESLATVVIPSDGSADRKLLAFEPGMDVSGRDDVLELVTLPNNPDFTLRQPEVSDPAKVIYDCIYYWPQFSSFPLGPLDGDVTIWSASKVLGMAGSRLGWAWVKDPEVADAMGDFISQETLGTNIEPQLRLITVVDELLAEGEGYPLGGFFDTVMNDMDDRWARLRAIVDAAETPGFVLENYDADRSPPYAWFSCPGDCGAIFDAVNLKGITGESFGTDSSNIRFTMMMRPVEMQPVLDRIEAALNQPVPAAAAAVRAKAEPGRPQLKLEGAGC